MEKKFVKKNYLSGLLLIIIALIVICLIFGKFFYKDKTFFLFKYSVFVVTSASMEPECPVNSVVIIKKTRFTDLKIGDVVAYKSDALNGRLAIHRITRVIDNGIYTKGDMNDYEDNQLITETSYVGKKTASVTFLAGLLSVFRSFNGFIALLLLIIAIKLAYNSFNLVKKTENKP